MERGLVLGDDLNGVLSLTEATGMVVVHGDPDVILTCRGDGLLLDREGIAKKLRASGFALVSLANVLDHFSAQSALSYKLDDRFLAPVLGAIKLLDTIPAAHPLEWVALFRKV